MTGRPQRVRQALCCVCGQVREFKMARNHRHENYWLHGPVDRDWHRELGDLKCAECGKVTTHALLHATGDWACGHAEELQRAALGDLKGTRFEHESWKKDLPALRQKYRQSNYPRNPLVSHKWWKSEENAARRAGEKWFPAMCGEMVAVPEEAREGSDITEMQAPTQITDPARTEHENLDVESGLWWTQDGTCVNCLKVRNSWLMTKRRDLLKEWLIWLAAHGDKKIADDQVETLIAACKSTQNCANTPADAS